MIVGNYKATWNHKTPEGKITLMGISPPSIQPVTQVIDHLSASEMSVFLSILRINEPLEYNASTGVLSMREAKSIPVT